MTPRHSAPATPGTASGAAHRQHIVRRIEQLAHRHNAWQVFSDFVELSAISISNAVDLVQRDPRETRYKEIVGRYSPEELAAFAEMLGEVVNALEVGFDDVLGRLFHDLELHNKYQGQFFTPYALCQLMAQVTLGEAASVERSVADRGYVTLLEPACGSGAMMIAAAEVLQGMGINYQQLLHATAVDVDVKCVHMAYVQLSLLHVPAVIVHGNSLSCEEYSRWYTPAHVMGGWSWRLRRGEADVPSPRPAVSAPDPLDVEIESEESQLVLL